MKQLCAFAMALACVCAGADTVAIGDKAEDVSFKDIRFLPRTLDDFDDAEAYIFLFHTQDNAEQLKALDALAEKAAAGIVVGAVDVTPKLSIVEVSANALEADGDYVPLKDFDGKAAAMLGVTHTPSAVVLDKKHRLQFRGTLEGALKALPLVAEGKEVEPAEEAVTGAPIVVEQPAVTGITFATDIAPILNKSCVPCHTPGEAAPFSLRTYKQAASRADMIAEVVREERMPPWYASAEHGKFMNDRRLSQEEKDKVAAWVKEGMPEGDLAKAPEPPAAPESDWRIGEPDLILTAEEEDTIPATGIVDYKYISLPHQFTEDTWVQGLEILPSNLSVVHHVNLAYNIPDSNYQEQSNFLTGRVPGNPPVDIPGPVAMLIPKGSVLFLQIHYVTTGKEQKNRMQVGLRYADGPILKRVYYKRLRPADINISPGEDRHRMESEWTFDRKAVGIALFSHMHVRGRDMSFFAKYPDGTEETLLVIPNYNFDWQLAYQYVPGTKTFPKGTALRTVSHYDNSPFNPYNPDPKATVTYGEQTADEMNDAYVFFLDADEFLNIQVDGATGQAKKEVARAE